MAYLIQPIEEERCVSLSYDGKMLPREIAAARYEAHGVLSARRWSRMIVDLTRLRFVPTSPQLLEFAKGFSGQVPPDGRVALVVRPEQVRDANLVEKVARKDGVFLSYFVDQGKASLWMQRSQPLRRTLGPAPCSQRAGSANLTRQFRAGTSAINPVIPPALHSLQPPQRRDLRTRMRNATGSGCRKVNTNQNKKTK